MLLCLQYVTIFLCFTFSKTRNEDSLQHLLGLMPADNFSRELNNYIRYINVNEVTKRLKTWILQHRKNENMVEKMVGQQKNDL